MATIAAPRAVANKSAQRPIRQRKDPRTESYRLFNEEEMKHIRYGQLFISIRGTVSHRSLQRAWLRENGINPNFLK